MGYLLFDGLLKRWYILSENNITIEIQQIFCINDDLYKYKRWLKFNYIL